MTLRRLMRNNTGNLSVYSKNIHCNYYKLIMLILCFYNIGGDEIIDIEMHSIGVCQCRDANSSTELPEDEKRGAMRTKSCRQMVVIYTNS